MVTLRLAHESERHLLSDLAVRSKRLWGYDEGFLRRARAELAVDRADIVAGRVRVAVEAGRVVGFVTLHLDADPPELVSLWVDPHYVRRGVGSALLQAALQDARSAGIDELVIESEPNAEVFYKTHGARRIGERESPTTSRSLPLIAIPTLRSETP